MKCRIYQVEGARNIRDIGGYPTASGERTAFGRFIRAGEINGLTRAGCAAVRELGVEAIVDLRSGREADQRPDTLMHDPAIRYIHIPMLDYVNSNFETGDFTNFPASMAELYISLLDRDQQGLREAMEAFVRTPGPVLFHCTAGKDRTGVVAMVLLALAGVSRELIAEDYSYSEALLEDSLGNPHAMGLPHYLFESRRESMETAYDHLQEHWGGAERYLTRIGVGEADRKRLLQKLLERG